MLHPRPLSRPGSAVLALVCASAVAAVTAARVRLAELPLERDEGEYAYSGQLLLRGIPPFRLAYSMKMPGTSGAYAAVMAAFGESPAAIRAGLLMVSATSALLLFLIARPAWGRATSAVAAAQFLVLAVLPTVLGQAAHATHFATLFGLAGVLVACRSGSPVGAACAGTLFGTAFLMKQHAVLLAPVGLLLVTSPPRWRRVSAGPSAAFLVGLLAPLLATLAVLALGGTLGRWWQWTVVYALDYVRLARAGQAISRFPLELRQIVAGAPICFLLAVVGLAAAARASRRDRVVLYGLTGLGLACAWPGLYFRQHYFVPALPGLALAAAVSVSWLRPVSATGGGRWREAGALALVAAALGQPLWSFRELLFRAPPETVSRRIYGANPFVEAAVIGRFLGEAMPAEARLAVLGSEPEIYFYARRLSATGYLYTYPLVDAHPDARSMQRDMAAEIAAARPEYVVFVRSSRSWHRGSLEGEPIYEWFTRYRARELEPVGVVELAPGRTSYRWGAGGPVHPALDSLEVLRRRR
jgi:4-amino-4-deoxy-L-arabinose transferase-like glycosyltransferase